ncbi:hypothetical protein SAMN05216268_11343 [Streptomyces yunnanensis]|uniref:Uncharacterized protein n=1 Tax=Streptomyces yunnanensis TaxID=156453 RepID=A0A9X8N1W1_9ACTN|nr:hypothetical protein SAMN05216268_11343 [Streptomyces yunnanensis]
MPRLEAAAPEEAGKRSAPCGRQLPDGLGDALICLA